MKKIFFLIAFLFLINQFQGFCQAKKPAKGQALSPLQIYTNKAKEWFKDVYVQTYFKDPYSYKLMKIVLSPITFDQKYQSLLESNERELNVADTSKSSSPYQINKRTYKALTSYPRDTMDYILIQYRDKISTSLSNYLSLKESSMTLRKTYEAMTAKVKNSVYEYTAYIECYGRNGYGGIVLNKYTFTIDSYGICTNVKSTNDE